MWEGILGKWKDELPNWLACPTASPLSSASAGQLQQLFSIWNQVTGGGEEETDDGLLCPHHWAKPIHALNCEIVWPKAIDEPPYSHNYLADEVVSHIESRNAASGGPFLELDTPEYAGVISRDWLVEKLLAQAGIRLAGVLNWLFQDWDEESDRKGLVADIDYAG
jgi:hypothetical protein